MKAKDLYCAIAREVDCFNERDCSRRANVIYMSDGCYFALCAEIADVTGLAVNKETGLGFMGMTVRRVPYPGFFFAVAHEIYYGDGGED